MTSLSNPVWKNFFATRSPNVKALLLAIPPTTYSVTTIVALHLSFYPETKNSRQWIDAVAAVALIKKDARWRKFFDRTFKSPLEMIAKIPEDSTQSKATIVNYYLLFHPEIKDQPRWINAVCGYLFCKRNKEAGVKLLENSLAIKTVKIRYGLKQKPETIRLYISALKSFDFKKEAFL